MSGQFKITVTRGDLPIEQIGGTSAQDRTVLALARVYEIALNVAYRKASGYGMAWERQGWMGNVARIMSKTARLENMVWRDMSAEDEEEAVLTEPVTETLSDLVNLAAFAYINFRAGNRWGPR